MSEWTQTIQLVDHSPGDAHGGIPRYTRELQPALALRAPVSITTNIEPPLARRLSFLRHLPPGVRARQAGSIVHFMQLMGCAQMLWQPIHPVVATIHDLGPLVCAADEPACHGFDRLLFNLQLAGLRRMDQVIAVSHFTKLGLVHRLGIPAERVHVAHHGLDHSIFRPLTGARSQLLARYPQLATQQQSYDLLYVGNELPRKNLQTLLYVLARLRAASQPVRLIKIGASGGAAWRAKFLADAQRARVADAIVIIENVPNDDLPLFYNAADLYVTTSVMEGFGWPVLEAMACGTPVVCSNAASLPEIVGDAALLCPSYAVEAFAMAIEQVLNNLELRGTLRTLGRAQAAGFTWEQTVERTLAVYASLPALQRVPVSDAVAAERHEVH